jgi:glycosyltransferase involved in cell wall biosynthesis
MEVKTIVCYSNSINIRNAMAHLRILGPARQAGLDIVNGLEKGKADTSLITAADLVIFQREFPGKFDEYEEIMTAARQARKPVVFDLDDLLLSLPEDHPDRQSHYYGSSLLPMYQAIMEADLVTVATPKLQEVLSPFNRNITVLHNYFDEVLWQLRPPIIKPNGEKITIGFMGGDSHKPDIDQILPMLMQLVERYPQKIFFKFWGLEPPAELLFAQAAEWIPHFSTIYQDFSSFFQTQSADIFIAPLVDNIFNRCKSPLKFFEYTALGVPVVLSRLEPFVNIVTHEQNGLLATTMEEWADCLSRLIEDEDLRFHLATNAQASIRENWLLSRNAFRWQETYRSIPEVATSQASAQEKMVETINVQLFETFVNKEAKIQAQAVEAASKDKQMEALTGQIHKLDQQAEELHQEIVMKDESINDLSSELTEIQLSTEWRFVLFFRRIQDKLAPPNSRQRRLVQKTGNVIIGPFKKARQKSALRREVALIRSSAYFDETWYKANNPDVVQANIDPLTHFIQHGGNEGRAPGPNFSSQWYLSTYSDVRKAGINPLVHYLKIGKLEGRYAMPENTQQEAELELIRSSGLFNEAWYLATYPDVAKAKKDPLLHFYLTGGYEGRDPGPDFSTRDYLSLHEDEKKVGINPLVHYLKSGTRKPAQSIATTSSTSAYVPLADEEIDAETLNVKLIAFYLPQFHPIPENDQWWGKGFTEWTNVSKALPNFEGHYQPRLPGELGFYDLRIPEIQKRQIELARKYGIYGFCFHYYWFNGKRLLERPLNQFLENPDLDFPFCLCWANENWTRRWDGLENEILIEQTHSEEEYLAFIRELIPSFLDKRYIRVDGKPLLMVYRISLLPNPKQAVEIWRSECKKNGIGEIYLVAAQSFGITDPRPYGFDAAVEFPPHNLWHTQIDKKAVRITNPHFTGRIFDYRKAVQQMTHMGAPDYTLYRTIMPSWDNTARKQNDGYVFVNSTPSEYKMWLEQMISYTRRNLPDEKQFIFINSWNEWGEGAYLEPDRLFGYAYLQATAEAVAPKPTISISNWTILFVSHDAIRGGAQAVLLNTILWLKEHTSIRLKVLCLDGGEWLPRFKELADTVVLKELQAGSAGKTENESAKQLLNFCGGSLDLIYGNTVAVGRVYKWLSRLGVPILTHVHELESSIRHYAGEWIGDILKYSAHYIAGSGTVRDNLINNHGVEPENISLGYASIIPTSASVTLEKEEKNKLRQQLGLDQNKFLVFGCGLGMPFRKGADLFIELGRVLQRKGFDNFHLYWMGDFEQPFNDPDHGNWSEYLDRLHDSKLNSSVTFLSTKKNPRDYLRSGDVFVLTSREEPFGLVALEAADSALPTICFTNAGASDFVEDDSGFVVPDEDIEAMALKIISLIEDEDLRRALGARAREKLLTRFTVERTTPQILSICRQVARQKPGVSVIVPNYNHSQYLPQRLDSIFSQTYQDFEVFLLDDASTDNSMEVLEKYRGRGDVHILQNVHNTGTPFKQWLRGIDLARSEILWMAESDDSCDPEFLNTLLPAFNDPNVKLAYANSHIIDEEGKVLGDYLNSPYLTSLSPTKWRSSYKVSAEREINDGLGVKDTILNASAVLFRKAELDKAFRDSFSGMKIAGDWYFIVNAIKGGTIQYDSRKLNYHRRHSESVIGKILKEKKLERFFQEFCLVQEYVFNNYKLAPEFLEKWEKYLRQQWDEFFPNRSFDELKSYYPFDEMKNLILTARGQSN